MFPVKSFYKRSSLKNYIRYAQIVAVVLSRNAVNFRIKLDQETNFSLNTRYSALNINAKSSLESMYQLGFGMDENSPKSTFRWKTKTSFL